MGGSIERLQKHVVVVRQDIGSELFQLRRDTNDETRQRFGIIVSGYRVFLLVLQFLQIWISKLGDFPKTDGHAAEGETLDARMNLPNEIDSDARGVHLVGKSVDIFVEIKRKFIRRRGNGSPKFRREIVHPPICAEIGETLKI